MRILLKNDSSLKNIAIVNGERFLESIFDRNQICKILLTKKRNIWKLNATDLLYVFLKV